MEIEAFSIEQDIERSNISYLKHKMTGLEVVRKTTGVQQGIEEINFLKKLRCDYFPTLLEFEVTARHVHIYMLKVRGVRWDQVNRDKKFHQYVVDNVEQVVRNIIHLLKTLKNEGIIHGDVKPDNLYIDEALNVRLIDFGSAMLEGTGDMHMYPQGTHRYMAPETILTNEMKTCISDCFGMGKSILELIGIKKIQCELEVLDRIKGLSSIRPDIREKYFESFDIFTCKNSDFRL